MLTYERASLLLLLAFFPAGVWAADMAEKTPQWWEVATGILAIPAVLIGLVYSFVLIKKERVETKKTELEIKEKEIALRKAAESEPSTATPALVAPLVEAKHTQLILLRFILLYITLRLWGLAATGFNFLLGGTFLGLQQLTGPGDDVNWITVPFFVLSQLPTLGEVAILLGIGLPLLRDVGSALGIDYREVLFFWRKR